MSWRLLALIPAVVLALDTLMGVTGALQPRDAPPRWPRTSSTVSLLVAPSIVAIAVVLFTADSTLGAWLALGVCFMAGWRARQMPYLAARSGALCLLHRHHRWWWFLESGGAAMLDWENPVREQVMLAELQAAGDHVIGAQCMRCLVTR